MPVTVQAAVYMLTAVSLYCNECCLCFLVSYVELSDVRHEIWLIVVFDWHVVDGSSDQLTVTKSSAARRRPPVNISRKKVVRYSSEVEFVTVSVECVSSHWYSETVSQLNVGFIFMVVLTFQLWDDADCKYLRIANFVSANHFNCRPHSSTSWMWPVAEDGVAWSVSHDCEPCKNNWTDQDAICDVDLGGPRESYVWWHCRSLQVKW